ncbi:uncharacterized protein [Palaemon carinicauda]|uniref:uncharacterized protein n=1 Tax=Palaemon carinicauda TaxID=392227 RepID=UPI0035B5B65F
MYKPAKKTPNATPKHPKTTTPRSSSPPPTPVPTTSPVPSTSPNPPRVTGPVSTPAPASLPAPMGPPAAKKKKGKTKSPPVLSSFETTVTSLTAAPQSSTHATAPLCAAPLSTIQVPEAEALTMDFDTHLPDCNCTGCPSQLLAEAAATPTPVVEPAPEPQPTLPAPTSTDPKQLPRIKLPATEDGPSYKAVAVIATANPTIKFTARANLKGNLIMAPKDQNSASLLQREASLMYLDPA